MKLDEHLMRLIAIGASVAINCQPCLETNLARARECSAEEVELTQAIWVGKMIRRAAASKMDDFASNLVKAAQNPSSIIKADCVCEDE